MRNSRLLIAALTILTLFVFLNPVSAESSDNIVKIGFYPMAGLQNVGRDGLLSGYTYDYLQEIAKITGWKYQYYLGDFAECLAKLKSGEIDFMGGMQKTEDRKGVFEFPDYSCGELYVELFVKGDNTKYAYEDIEAFNGMTVGVIRGLAGNKDLEKYCSDNNFSVNIREYSGDSEMMLALENNEIDAFTSLSTLPRKGLRSVAAFGYKNFYFMASKGKPELLKKMNYALEKIKIQSPFYEQELKRRYLPTQKNFIPVFTREELDYIKKLGIIDVVYNKNWIPLERQNETTGEFEGITADIFELISKLSGLKFNYIPEENHANAYRMLYNNDVQIKCSAPSDYIWAAKNNIKISHEYLNVPAVMVSTKRGNNGKTVAAMPEGLHITDTIEKGFPNYEYKKYATYEECFEAILKGEANVTFANSLQASEYLKKPIYSNMNVVAMNEYFTRHCIGFSNDVDAMLISIIDKTLACISTEQMNEIIVAHTMTFSPITAVDLVYQHPMGSVLIISGVFGAFIFLLLVSLHNKTRFARMLYAIVNIDELTGESSHTKFCRDADKLLREAKRPQYLLMYINIAKFKDINALYGYAVGDKVLRAVCEHLKKNLDPDELFTRLHADHFIVLLNCPDLESFEKRYVVLISGLSNIFLNKGLPCKLRLMTGAYFLADTDKDVVLCTDRARYAHRQCDSEIPHSYVFYDDELERKIQTEHILESQMEDALANGEFKVYYQPKTDSRTGIINGAEALIRWQNSEYGMLSPLVFIPLFERNTFIGSSLKRVAKGV